MRKIIFRLSFIFSLIVICLYLVTPLFSITELLYPVKIDSAYIHAQQLHYEKERAEGKTQKGKIFLYNPSQLHLVTDNFSILTRDNFTLNGWYVSDSLIKSSATLILIPDLTESKWKYIETASEFVARGINVCMMDMRAQGESEGTFYTMGKVTIDDVSIIIDSLISKYKTQNIVLMGTGTGAAIALQVAETEKRVKVLVLQNPFLSLDDYLTSYANKKYGRFGKWFYKRMKKDLEREMKFSVDSLNLSELVKKTEAPVYFISYISKNNLDYKATEVLYGNSVSSKKEWIVFKEQREKEKAFDGNKKYFDKIAAFINSNIPKKKNNSRFKKLVLN